MTPANQLLRVLADRHYAHGANTALNNFLDQLRDVQARHVKKKTSEEHLLGWVFGGHQNLAVDSVATAYCRAHLVIAIRCFEELEKEVRQSGKSLYSALNRYGELIRDYVYDVAEIVTFLEQKKEPSFIFLQGHKNYGTSSWEIFRFSHQLAVQSAHRSQQFHFAHKTAQIISVFALRQALEVKFQRIVGIDLRNNKGESPRLKHSFHYDFIKKNSQYFEFRAIDFGLLEKIYAWCNDIVHSAYQPYAWQLAYAHKTCSDFFASFSSPHQAAWSIHNAVEIHQFDDMQQSFLAHFRQNYDHGTWCVDQFNPEAIICS